jgi:type II secretory pathway pseudopilin PulG
VRRGFSLVESILSLALFLLFVLAGIESFGTARRVFFRLQEVQSSRMAALAALDKIKVDILQAGRGLAAPIRMGIASGAEREAGGWAFWNAEKEVRLTGELRAGQSFISVAGMGDVAAGRQVCISDEAKGEKATIADATGQGLALSSPLARDYPAGQAVLLLLRRVLIYHDCAGTVLRRKINAASGQPLLDRVSAFSLELEGSSPRAEVRIEIEGEGEVLYETTVVAKNLALAKAR